MKNINTSKAELIAAAERHIREYKMQLKIRGISVRKRERLYMAIFLSEKFIEAMK